MTVQRQLASVSTSSQDRDEQTHSGGNCSSWWLSLWQACFITLSVRGVVFNTQLHSGLQGTLRRWGVTLRPRSEAAHRTRASSCWAVSAGMAQLCRRLSTCHPPTPTVPSSAFAMDVVKHGLTLSHVKHLIQTSGTPLLEDPWRRTYENRFSMPRDVCAIQKDGLPMIVRFGSTVSPLEAEVVGEEPRRDRELRVGIFLFRAVLR